MAKIILDNNETFTVGANSVANVVGNTGSEKVLVTAGSVVTTDQNVEREEFSGASSSYTYSVSGNVITVKSGTTTVGTIAAGGTNQVLAFSDGSAPLVMTGLNAVTLGGTAVPTTAATIAPTLNTTDKSTVATTTTTSTLPTLSVAPVSANEGNTGTTNFNFTVTLSAASASAVTVAYATTASSSSVSGVDFTPTSGTLTIAAGQTTGTITVPVIGNTIFEPNKIFSVTLSNPTNATVSTTAGSATGTIVNDDTNALPVITVPTTASSVFIGTSTAVTGISFTDANDNTGFTVTLQATGSSQLSFSSLTATSGNTVAAQNAAGAAVAVNATSNLITLTGTKADVNSVLANLKYSTNSTVPTSESISVKVVDPNGGTTTSTAPVNVGSNLTLTSGNDSLVGSAGDDLFTGTYANLGTADTLVGGLGNDKLALTGTTGALPTFTTSATGIEILDVTTQSSTASTTADAVSFSAANFGTSLNTVNFTTRDSLGGADSTDTLTATTVNAGTTFNIQNSAGSLTLSALNGTEGTADAFTVNLAGGVTLGTFSGTGTTLVDILNINSNGTSANTISTVQTLNTTASTINAGGTQALTITNALPNLGTGKFDASNASGKITVTAGAFATTIIGGSAGDVITGGSVAGDSLSGGAGNDTITGTSLADTITGGTGADSLTGGLGNDTFVFAAGDSPSTGRDTITDLSEGDIIKFGTALTGLTNGATLTTSSANPIYVDAVNNRLVVGNDQINIPSAIVNAPFTYSYGADSIVGTADDTITIGAAPLVPTNNAIGTLTLTGKAIGDIAIVLNDASAPTVGGSSVGNNSVTTVIASSVSNKGINQTVGTVSNALTVTGTSSADTITGGAGNDTLTGGNGNDAITLGNGDDVVVLTGDAITSATNNTDTITGFFSASTAGSIDVLKFGSTFTGGTAFGSGGFITEASGAVTSGDYGKIIDLTTSAAAYSGAAAIFSVLSATNFSTAANSATMKSIVIADNGTNEYIWYVNDLLDGSSALSATDVVLIGILSATTGGTFVAGNFGAAV